MVLATRKTLTWGTVTTAVVSAMLLAYADVCEPILARHGSRPAQRSSAPGPLMPATEAAPAPPAVHRPAG